MKNIPLETARRFILSKQMLLPPVEGGSTGEVVDVVKRLGGVQYDPLPVVEQAHYLTLWKQGVGLWLSHKVFRQLFILRLTIHCD